MRHFDMFSRGAAILAGPKEWSKVHARHGLSQAEWDLFTQDENWTASERTRIRGIIHEVLNVSQTIAGLPAMPLAGHYAAAVIALLVAIPNRMVATACCPTTFDTEKASGLKGPVEIVEMSREQLIALVIAYSNESVLPVPEGEKDELLDTEAKAGKAPRRRAANEG